MRFWHLMIAEEGQPEAGLWYRGPEIINAHVEIAGNPAARRAASATPITQSLVLAGTAVNVLGDPMELGTTTEPPNVIVIAQHDTDWDTYHFDSDELEGGALQRSVDPDDETKPHPAGPPEDPASLTIREEHQ